jgi:hypothetical protein
MVNGVPSGYQKTGPSYLDILTAVTINRFDSGSRQTGANFQHILEPTCRHNSWISKEVCTKIGI